MKKYIAVSLRLTIVMLFVCCGIYFGIITLIGKTAPGGGEGETVAVNGKVVGYANVGQKFTDDKYFWGRPSSVDYNAAGSGGSNKAGSNPDYINQVKERIDSFLVHNPDVSRGDIPAEMVTASGSGLDPDISPESAYIQVARIAKVRNMGSAKIKNLVEDHIVRGTFAPDKINVLKLNVELDAMK